VDIHPMKFSKKRGGGVFLVNLIVFVDKIRVLLEGDTMVLWDSKN